MSDAIRVVVADDQAVVREGLMTLLEIAAGIEPVAAAADGEEAVALAARHRPHVVLMDLRMPRLDGVEATRRIRAAQPDTEVVVLTTHADDQSILGALHAGARGYLTKDAGIAEISRAIQAAAAHQALLDPAVQSRLLAAATAATAVTATAATGTAATGTGPTATAATTASTAAPAPPAPAAELPDGLTPREAEVLRLIARGMSNAEIAGALVVSEATVKSHINHLFAKIGARDRAQAVHYAYTHGLAG
jgi:DNA-binding NarL/FixJ family response regulator